MEGTTYLAKSLIVGMMFKIIDLWFNFWRDVLLIGSRLDSMNKLKQSHPRTKNRPRTDSSTGATAARCQTSSTQQQYTLEKDLSSYADNNANANGEHKEGQLKSPPEMLMRRNRKGFE